MYLSKQQRRFALAFCHSNDCAQRSSRTDVDVQWGVFEAPAPSPVTEQQLHVTPSLCTTKSSVKGSTSEG
jgi:hypothetical protein